MASNATIKAIDSSTIHQIQSGQVIVDLCSVAKELVENGIDAGATAIEVRFKNQGLDAIEVQDNGSGIAADNYETVALKHYTSKLSTYDDLSTLQTFGFRGEALSSLCALSHFSIVTCTQQQAPKAAKLEFEVSGKLKSTGVVSGQKGTTVYVEKLFHNLPVRRRELERNIKREWTKVIALLNQYACIQTGVKFTVSQQPTKGKRMVLFSTRGNPTTRENIINVFGVKTMSALITLDLKLELTPTATGPIHKRTAVEGDGTTAIHIKGHVSRPAHGEGRQTPDRQMFYVNGRPCGLPQFAKVFNEVYRSYNNSQSPFIFADIQLDTHLYDVNVSPDKRTILLHDQGQMLANLRESLIELFEIQDVTVPVAQASTQRQTPFKKPALGRSATPSGSRDRSSTGPAPTPRRSTRAGRITGEEDGDEEEDGAAADGDEDEENEDEEEDEPKTLPRSLGKRALPSRSASDAQSSPLMARWLAKKTDFRKASELLQAEADGSDKAHAPNEEQAEPQEENSVEQPREDVIKTTDYKAVRVRDFHARLAELEGKSPPVSPTVSRPNTAKDPDDDEMEVEEDEPPIPAIPPPSQPSAPRSTLSPVRPFKRSTQEVATITIGDSTVTSVIGSPSKRLRLDQRTGKAATTARKQGKRAAPLPSFGGRLTQLFSASARQQQDEGEDADMVNEDVEEEEEEEEEPELEPEEERQEDEDEEGLFVSQDEQEPDDEGSCDEEIAARSRSVDGVLPDPGERDDDEVEDDANSPHVSVVGRSPESDNGQDEEDDDAAPPPDEAEDNTEQPPEAAEPTAPATEAAEEAEKRAKLLLKGKSKRKDMTLGLVQRLNMDESTISSLLTQYHTHVRPLPLPLSSQPTQSQTPSSSSSPNPLEEAADTAEEKLSLKITKSDFHRMRIIGQFNLGFIIAVRPPHDDKEGDELFIIDQHASDEKYNFERLQAQTVVQSQRLVTPKQLELTAVEEEIVIDHLWALERNGFNIRVDTSGDKPVGSRCELLSLPLSRETTFSLADLEELISLLGDSNTNRDEGSVGGYVPRPSKVRKMFAMRACRSSIMIGKALSLSQMEKVVRHMGEMDKPWNCPHGRPTMRHLCGLETTTRKEYGGGGGGTWREGDDFEHQKGEEEEEEGAVDWAGYVLRKKRT
ncbi:mismatch repair endonuclease PMS2 [Diplogelasinospora grovesii]|uniref:DNA mismatch repair protein PMS1 n=1 Tax=Diplogelasinospora grovesii TaxID=303347 RepID=A0AAN6S8B0_9PEZI|nr:mismatch repair endonuclease PMS2 [Diplogelasinospora grovesii]